MNHKATSIQNQQVPGFTWIPVYHESGMLQKESDVYSLGVVLLEMLTRMLAYYEKAIEKDDEPQFLINFVRRYFDDGLDMLIDPFIKDQIDRRSFHTFKYIAYECISLNSMTAIQSTP